MRRIGRVVGLFLAIAALGALAATGCSRKKGPGPSSASPAALPSVSPVPLVLRSSPRPSLPPSPRPSPKKGFTDLGELAKPVPSPVRLSAASPSPNAGPRVPSSGPFALFGLSPLSLDFPQDFDLGSIQAEFPPDAEQRAAALPAYAFLEGLKKGKLDASVVAPAELSKLTRALYPLTKKNASIADFRLGLLKRDGDAAQAHAALYSEQGMAIAEIYLLKDGGAWKVEAFNADFDSLDKPRQKAQGRFEPGEYKAFTPF